MDFNELSQIVATDMNTLHGVHDQIAASVADLATKQQAATDAQNATGPFDAAVADAQRALDLADATVAARQGALSDAQAAVVAAQSALDAAGSTVVGKRSDLEMTQQAAQPSHDAVTAAQNDVATVQGTITSLSTQAQQLTAEMAAKFAEYMAS